MNVLVVSATEFEIEPLMHENNIVDILITGIGIPATIFHLTKKLSDSYRIQKNYDLVIQAGIAGTFSTSLKKGTVLLVNKDAFADLGINEKGDFKTLFDTGFMNENEFPFTKGWLENLNEYHTHSSLSLAKGITVNKITDDVIQIKKLSEKFNPDIESMEGAALHYVCLQQKINFLQLRSISNTVGERDKQKWGIKEAIVNLNVELKKLIQEFI
jgi:futalosine hydrolase